mmetsp:Transcript_26193/g.64683  ORF Transcript_26193/g.64683 Transcript_26193/m.64683 type:complete len:202 (+) Transcript_26193:227-832(+)
MACSLWATCTIVASDASSATARITIFSVRASRLEVASSRISTLLRLSSALATHTSCLWPVDRFSPRSATWDCSPPCVSTYSLREALSSALHRSSSSRSSKGSRFRRIVPANITGSWLTTDKALRRRASPSCEMSTPFSTILPPSSSSMRVIAATIVDLPAPVRPTTATFSPLNRVTERPLTAGVSLVGYRTMMSSKERLPS